MDIQKTQGDKAVQQPVQTVALPEPAEELSGHAAARQNSCQVYKADPGIPQQRQHGGERCQRLQHLHKAFRDRKEKGGETQNAKQKKAGQPAQQDPRCCMAQRDAEPVLFLWCSALRIIVDVVQIDGLAGHLSAVMLHVGSPPWLSGVVRSPS